jgi:hypothetical protein
MNNMKTNQELQDLSIQELKAYASDLGLNVKGNFGKEKLVSLIEQKQDNPDMVVSNLDEYDVSPQPQPVLIQQDNPIILTMQDRFQDIKELLSGEIKNGLEVEADDVAWTMTYNAMTISGSLTLPNPIISRQALALMSRVLK